MAGLLTAGYLAMVVVALVALAAVGVLAWRRRPSRVATAMTGLAAAVVVWLVATLVSVLAADYRSSVLAAKLAYLGITTVPPSFLLVSLLYTGRERWVDRRLLAALAVEPVAVTVVLWTVPGWFWTARPAAGSLSGIDPAYGPLFWLHVAYAYGLTLLATALLLELLYRSRYLDTQQVAALLVGALAPWLSNALYLSGVVPVDLTPVAFAVAGAALAWAILAREFIDLGPVARGLVVEQINHAVLVVDAANRLVDVNRAGERLLGVDDGHYGAAIEDVLADYPALRETLLEDCENREVVLVDTDRGRRALDVEVTTMTDYRGREQGRAVLVQDVTDQRRREQELRARNEQLDRFASVVSHDLRNPLNVVGGYVREARETGDVSVLSDAEESVDRMNRIVEDVLTLAREGAAVGETEPVDLRTVAEAAWDNVDTAGATLRVVDDDTLEADRSRLTQAIENLVRNAVEHGGETVTVEVGQLADGEGFYVADDGPGIPVEARDRIFEYGYTTDSEGTGFGLAIVDTIAEAHGWDLVLGTADEGARFEFREADAHGARRAADSVETSPVGGTTGESSRRRDDGDAS